VTTASPTHSPPAPEQAFADDDRALVAALLRRDEQVFVELVTRYQASMKRIARIYVSSDALADDVVQEAWVGVLKGLPRFEGRSSLSTWIFRILTNVAKTRGARERRMVPFTALAGGDGPSVDEDRFGGDDSAWPGHWAVPPRPWENPERRLCSLEMREELREAIRALPPAQQAVLTLRDVEGLSAEEVCGLLDLNPTNQRVILHRARSRVRANLERHLDN
jgi:RNA polymerase sigma-70 factor, ECF subfamily